MEVTRTRTSAKRQLLKDGSGLTWAQLLDAVPQVKTTWNLLKSNSAFGGSLVREYWPFDVSAIPVDPESATIEMTGVDPQGTVDKFKLYYQDFGATVEAGDWVSTAGLTAASDWVDATGLSSISITLISLSNIRSSNGRFVAVCYDEATDPGVAIETSVYCTGVSLVMQVLWSTATGTVTIPPLSATGAATVTNQHHYATGELTLGHALSTPGGSAKQRHTATGTLSIPALTIPASHADTFTNTPIPLSRVKGGRVSIQDITDGKVSIHES